jgi:xanthine dehydrogenase FAD-binding subunit
VNADVRCPRDLAGLWPLLEDGAVVMAGGTDLLARGRGKALAFVACLERIESLRGVGEEDGVVRLGACETHARLLRHPLVSGRIPLLAGALVELGSPLIRNMGTLGGNIVTASPAGDTLAPLYALDAQVELASRLGTRRVSLDGFIAGPGITRLDPGEIVAAVLLPPPSPEARQHFEKVGRRKALAISVASLAAVIRTDREGVVTDARLALGSVGPTVIRCKEAEESLAGCHLDRESLLAAGAAVRREIAPVDDLRASAAYRRDVAGNLLLRIIAATP